MNQRRQEDAQSFLLRFWYERSELSPGYWRGVVWHQQKSDGNGYSAVAGPEEAFEAVRRALEKIAPLGQAPPPAGSATSFPDQAPSPPPARPSWRRLMADFARCTLGRGR